MVKEVGFEPTPSLASKASDLPNGRLQDFIYSYLHFSLYSFNDKVILIRCTYELVRLHKLLMAVAVGFEPTTEVLQRPLVKP